MLHVVVVTPADIGRRPSQLVMGLIVTVMIDGGNDYHPSWVTLSIVTGMINGDDCDVMIDSGNDDHPSINCDRQLLMSAALVT